METASMRPALAAGAADSTGRRLTAVVLVAGAGALVVEIGASRLLAPYFGSSTVVWANIIGMILAYLSVGYWLGGRLADRRPEPRLLGGLILTAAVAVAALPFVARPVLDLTVEGLDRLSGGAVVGSFFAALALFAIPVTILGTVSPFAVRLGVRSVGSAGTVAGRLYAVSTAGSILGTFVSALVLIPTVGTHRTLLAAAALLALAGSLLLDRRWLLAAPALAGLLALPPGAIKREPGVLFETESTYQYVQVVAYPGGWRAIRLNEGIVSHSLWRADSVFTGGEWDMFLVVPPLLAAPPKRMLVIGNSGGTIARAFGALYPEVEIDGVEIDSDVSKAGERYLGLGDNPRLHVITADGRPFLQTTPDRYDLIAIDAYRQPYIPFYLSTKEFFELVRDRLAPGGVVALNVARVPGDERLARSIASTMATVFPGVWQWPALRFNELLLGTTEAVTRDQLARRVAGIAPAASSLSPLFARDVSAATLGERPLTDDRAPVEWVTDGMILRYARDGSSLDERFLPTRPG